MTVLAKSLLATLALLACTIVVAQTDDTERLKITALEALISAPPERALPIVSKVLNGDGSTRLKQRALFVLGQIDLPEARATLLDVARSGTNGMRLEAIRMIGISGDEDTQKELASIYASGDDRTREAVLNAYLIADNAAAIYQIAANTNDSGEFERAVSKLGAMGARDELRALRDRTGMAEILIDAYAVAGDVESLTVLANDDSDPERQARAIRGLGITGDDGVAEVLTGIYRKTASAEVRNAALNGLMIGDFDEAVLTLFRESQDATEKRRLLQVLVNMDSDAAWDIIDATLENGQ
jgi:HEAT repeat protein